VGLHISLGLGKSTGRISSYASYPITPKEAILRDLESHSKPRAGAGIAGEAATAARTGGSDGASAAPQLWAERPGSTTVPHPSPPSSPQRESHHTSAAETGLSTGRRPHTTPVTPSSTPAAGNLSIYSAIALNGVFSSVFVW
jgi:hypothetical protein